MMSVADRTSGIVVVSDFFPELNGDLTKVIWAHGVNSQQKLLEAVEGKHYVIIIYQSTFLLLNANTKRKRRLIYKLGSAMMLEADILMGTTASSSKEVPIMAHPPDTTSDLTFGGFLDTILHVNAHMNKKKGIKLDFKDIAAVEPVLMMLEREFVAERLRFPIWLNADVLKGPINSTMEPINGTSFISLAKRYLSTATLSLGWTTRYGRDDFGAAEARGQ